MAPFKVAVALDSSAESCAALEKASKMWTKVTDHRSPSKTATSLVGGQSPNFSLDLLGLLFRGGHSLGGVAPLNTPSSVLTSRVSLFSDCLL